MSEEDPFDLEQVPDALEAYKKQLDALKAESRFSSCSRIHLLSSKSTNTFTEFQVPVLT